MKLAPIFPVQFSGDRARQDPTETPRKDSPAVSKVKNLVLERIGVPETGSALLPSASVPKVLIDFLETGRQIEFPQGLRPSKRSKKPFSRKSIPIGLKKCEKEWLNAFIQFLLALPGFADLVFFAPRSFEQVQAFVRQYRLDQNENRVVSRANTRLLMNCLMRKLPAPLFKKTVPSNLYEIFVHLVTSLSSSHRFAPLNAYFSDSIAFHAEWHLIWDVASDSSLQEAIEAKLEEKPAELLVVIKRIDSSSFHRIKKQFCTPSEWLCYDLDAFIEMRSDEGTESFVTYLKIDGGWYQCDDEKITLLRSTSLNIPLYRSVFLHYKRIEFGRPG